MASFQYHPRIIESYPKLVGGVVVASGLRNAPSPPALVDAYLAEQAAVKARVGNTALAELPSLQAWRRAFSAFGVSPTKYRSAAEALLRRLTKKGDIPSINTLVDIGNLVSIRYGVPVAVMDTSQTALPITVHYADGGETYTELNSAEVMHPAIDEVVFSDEKRMVVARRWCWRQSYTSRAGKNTKDAVITIEAHHDGARTDIENAVNDLLALLEAHAGGSCESGILTGDNPAI